MKERAKEGEGEIWDPKARGTTYNTLGIKNLNEKEKQLKLWKVRKV